MYFPIFFQFEPVSLQARLLTLLVHPGFPGLTRQDMYDYQNKICFFKKGPDHANFEVGAATAAARPLPWPPIKLRNRVTLT